MKNGWKMNKNVNIMKKIKYKACRNNPHNIKMVEMLINTILKETSLPFLFSF